MFRLQNHPPQNHPPNAQSRRRNLKQTQILRYMGPAARLLLNANPHTQTPAGIAGRSDEHHVQAKLACDESISELRVVIGFTALGSVTHQPPSHDDGGNHASVRLLPRGSPRACSRPTSREERLVHRDCNCGVHHCIRIAPLALSADANRCYGAATDG
jgi:hypothetical protein